MRKILIFFMLMYNLLEYSDNYSMASGRLWNYYRDVVNDATNEIDTANNKINNSKPRARIILIPSTPASSDRLDAEIVVSCKYLIIFWRSLDLPLINCQIQLV